MLETSAPWSAFGRGGKSLIPKPEVVKLEVGGSAGPKREEAGSCVLTEADWLHLAFFFF